MLPAPPTLSPVASQYLRKLIADASAIVLDDKKDYLLQARLAPLMAKECCPTWEAFVDRLKQTGAGPLRRRVVEAMTTHETSFFRDFHPFEALRLHVLPQLAKVDNPGRTLNVWSAAASSGQELYSIAMLIRQQGARFAGWNVRLLGTDLSGDILEKAKQGRYSQLEVNRGLPALFLAQHFVRQGAEWQIKQDIRDMAEFRTMNLIEPWPPLPQMDLVFLRNVLIYFDIPTKRMILDRMAGCMRLGGLLFLGGVETTLNLSTRFAEQPMDKTVAFRRVV